MAKRKRHMVVSVFGTKAERVDEAAIRRALEEGTVAHYQRLGADRRRRLRRH